MSNLYRVSEKDMNKKIEVALKNAGIEVSILDNGENEKEVCICSGERDDRVISEFLEWYSKEYGISDSITTIVERYGEYLLSKVSKWYLQRNFECDLERGAENE